MLWSPYLARTRKVTADRHNNYILRGFYQQKELIDV
jgi:hypothetical protein